MPNMPNMPKLSIVYPAPCRSMLGAARAPERSGGALIRRSPAPRRGGAVAARRRVVALGCDPIEDRDQGHQICRVFEDREFEPRPSVDHARWQVDAGDLIECLAELVAAQQFNESEGIRRESLLGAVTMGSNWRFVKLSGIKAWIDLPEYSLAELGKILAILLSGL